MAVGSLLDAADVGEADVCDAEVAAGSAVGYGAAVGAAACGAAVAIAAGGSVAEPPQAASTAKARMAPIVSTM